MRAAEWGGIAGWGTFGALGGWKLPRDQSKASHWPGLVGAGDGVTQLFVIWVGTPPAFPFSQAAGDPSTLSLAFERARHPQEGGASPAGSWGYGGLDSVVSPFWGKGRHPQDSGQTQHPGAGRHRLVARAGSARVGLRPSPPVYCGLVQSSQHAHRKLRPIGS